MLDLLDYFLLDLLDEVDALAVDEAHAYQGVLQLRRVLLALAQRILEVHFVLSIHLLSELTIPILIGAGVADGSHITADAENRRLSKTGLLLDLDVVILGVGEDTVLVLDGRRVQLLVECKVFLDHLVVHLENVVALERGRHVVILLMPQSRLPHWVLITSVLSRVASVEQVLTPGVGSLCRRDIVAHSY